MADIIAFASGKGGVGKSTVTVNIAEIFACNNKKILLIDGDEALNSLDIMLNVREKTVYGWNDVADEICDIKSALVKCSDNIDLLSSPQKCENPHKLGEIINSVKDNYDFILIDAPAGIGDDFENIVKICDKLIIVATADTVSVSDGFAAYKKATLNGLQNENIRLLINRFDKKAAKKSRLLNIDGVIDRTGVRLLGIIPEEKNIMYSTVTGEKHNGNKKFYSAVDRICMRIVGKDIPLRL